MSEEEKIRIICNTNNEHRILKYEKDESNTRIITSIILHEIEDKSLIPAIDEMMENEVNAEIKTSISEFFDLVSNAFVAHYDEIVRKNNENANQNITDQNEIIEIKTQIPGLEKLHVRKVKFDQLMKIYSLNEEVAKKFPLLDVINGKFTVEQLKEGGLFDMTNVLPVLAEIFVITLSLGTVYGGAVFFILNWYTNYESYALILLQILHAIIQAIKRHVKPQKELISYVNKVKNFEAGQVEIIDPFFVFNKVNEKFEISKYRIEAVTHTNKPSIAKPLNEAFQQLINNIKVVKKISKPIKYIGYVKGFTNDTVIGMKGKKLPNIKRNVVGVYLDEKSSTLWVSHPLLCDAFELLHERNIGDGKKMSLDEIGKIPDDLVIFEIYDDEKLNSLILPFMESVDLKTNHQVSYGYKTKTNEQAHYKFVSEYGNMNFNDPIFSIFFPNHFIKVSYDVGIDVSVCELAGYNEMDTFTKLVTQQIESTASQMNLHEALNVIHNSHLDCGCYDNFGIFLNEYFTTGEVLEHIKETKVKPSDYHLNKMYVDMFTKRRPTELQHLLDKESKCMNLAYNPAFFDAEFDLVGDKNDHTLVVKFPRRKPYYRFLDENHGDASTLSLYEMVISCKNGKVSNATKVGFNVMSKSILPNPLLKKGGRGSPNVDKTRYFEYDLVFVTFSGDITQYLINDWIGENLSVYDESHSGVDLFKRSSVFQNGCFVKSADLHNEGLIELLRQPQNKLNLFMEGIVGAMCTDMEMPSFKSKMLQGIEALQCKKDNEVLVSGTSSSNQAYSFRNYIRSTRSGDVITRFERCIKIKSELHSPQKMCDNTDWFEFGRLGHLSFGTNLSEVIRSKHELLTSHPCGVRFRSFGYFRFGKSFKCKTCRNSYQNLFRFFHVWIGATIIQRVKSVSLVEVLSNLELNFMKLSQEHNKCSQYQFDLYDEHILNRILESKQDIIDVLLTSNDYNRLLNVISQIRISASELQHINGISKANLVIKIHLLSVIRSVCVD
ncbi:putative 115.3 kDa protein [Fiji disease virus]|uniref:Uncharacterized protein VP5 n=1 Tax=Fiji disease virus (isolate Sugarcane) TaxID=648172 RepID=VP5_FDVS|nr:putative 115.3 kDa protein [Fiji disease virus]Q8JYK0.1 RecName: Full=Uncharacterized protein VP5 [Fiji disease virus isolate Sugarcane]AAK40250.1 putative 115.3 kDa protein [Fiji disease virus]